MRKPEGYREFQERVFQEIDDLTSQRNRVILEQAAAAYGFTADEALLKFYTPGMDGHQFLEAMKAAASKE